MEEASKAPSLILLAAGNGTRMGGPKALLRCADGTALLTRQVDRMAEAAASRGLSPDIVVVLGTAFPETARLVPAGARMIENPDVAAGLSTSLRAGLQAVQQAAVGAVITLLDLPHIPAEAIGRMLDATTPEALARAQWNSTPGHPVAIGREHFDEAVGTAAGDEGLRTMLKRHEVSGEVSGIECADLLPPELDGLVDVDTPEAAARLGLHLEGTH